MLKPKLLVLVGPTAVGKTKLSLSIAEKYGAEIISGDSMQVYRGMDIGTAKASPQEQARVPHHMIDIHNPDYPFSVAEFQERAVSLIANMNDQGKLPFIVGGTGLYIESVCYGYQFAPTETDEAFREEMRQYAIRHGAEALHEKLRQADPESAAKLHPNDQRRIIRALEVYHTSGEKLSDQLLRQKKASPYELCIVGLTMDRAILYKRIETRIDLMIQEGLLDEVKQLLDQGYGTGLVSMQGLGYKEIAAYLEGRYSLEDALSLLKQNTRRFAKRQLSWFKHMNEIQWVDMTDESKYSEQLKQVYGIISHKLAL